MSYLEIFQAYINNEINRTSAAMKIEKEVSNLLMLGQIKEYQKAVMCCTYFTRYDQYNHGHISAKDLLLFIRDFILYIGRFRFPRLITDAVEREGIEFGIYVAEDGSVDALEKYPETLKKQKNMIDSVYSLGTDEGLGESTSSGDDFLIKNTKFKSYKSLEQKIGIHSAIGLPDNHTLLISLPTGGGKSLITQLLAATECKLTLVIVPTVSLAKDQYLQAKASFIDDDIKDNIFYYKGDGDNELILSAIKNKTARLVFTSPEAVIKSLRFNKRLKEAAENNFLHNIVIDEAHIVTDWGVHFRPDFQIFSVVLKEFRKISEYYIRTFLLSATLADDVVEVLFDLFGENGKNVEYRCDSLRKEPRYTIVENRSYDGRQEEVLEMVKYLPKPLIVYVIEPTTAKQYVKQMKKMGFKNIFAYTGETNDRDRELLLENWKSNQFDVIFATSAFGMGVDKSNVRTVIHSCIPENLSRFYQEVGRAGRDGLPSLSVLSYFTSKVDKRNDLSVAFGLINKSILKKENIVARLESILSDEKNVIDGDYVIADLNTVPKTFSEEEAEHAGMRNMCWNANTLLLLHRQGYIDIDEASYDNMKKSYFFRFKINNVELVQNMNELENVISPDREKEYDMRIAGYKKMAELVHKPKSKCWGHQFTSLFPYAQPICSGCPVHADGTGVNEDTIKIRNMSIVNIKPDEPMQQLKRRMGSLNDILVPIDDYMDVDICEIIDKANKLQLSCIVVPDNVVVENAGKCLCVKHSEFVKISRYVHWLFRNGIMLLMSDDTKMNNQLFESLNYGLIKTYRKVWCCKPTTYITSQNRTINEFLNCRTHNLNRL